MNFESGKNQMASKGFLSLIFFLKANTRTNSSKFPVPVQTEECYIDRPLLMLLMCACFLRDDNIVYYLYACICNIYI